MNKMKKTLLLAPRIAGIIFVVFISLFALDVFDESYTARELVIAIVMHMIPTFTVIITLLIAWRWEKVGGIIFIILGLFYLFMTLNNFNLSAFLLIPIPLLLIGATFILHDLIYHKRNFQKNERREI